MHIKMRYIWLWLLGIVLQSQAATLYLEEEVRAALQSRDDCYGRLHVKELLFPFPGETKDFKESLGKQLSPTSPDSSTQWYYFLIGLAAEKTIADVQPALFTKACQTAGNNPASLWILSVEFGRCGQKQWEMRCLERLYKFFLTAGVSRAPLIAQSLLVKATIAGKNHNLTDRDAYLSWAEKFDPASIRPSIQTIFKSFPTQISNIGETANRLAARIHGSWQLQALIALHAILWLRWLVTFFVFATLMVTAVRYVPSGLHWATELLPSSLSQTKKMYLVCLLFASLFSLGVVPGLWLLIVCIWRHCSHRDKWLVTMCMSGLLTLPFMTRVEDMLRQCLSPTSAPTLFYRVCSEGVSGDLDRAMHDFALTHADDYLAVTAEAIYAIKHNDLASASQSIHRALTLSGNDPAVLMTEGIVSFYSGNFLQAKTSFETCARLYPDFAPAVFNLGQCLLASNETFKGMDYIDRAEKLNPSRIHSFIKLNDDFFQKNWPLRRQLMQPEYPNGYFWKNVFPRYWGSFSTADALWGNTCWGIPILLYWIMGIAVMAALGIMSVFVWTNANARKIFLCKLCGAAMCRRCKKGMICASCFYTVQPIRNENIRQRIIEKIIVKNRKISLWTEYCSDVLFPGAGMLYKRGGALAAALTLLASSSALYAMAAMLAAMTPLYACPDSRAITTVFLCALALYVLLFAVRAFSGLKKEKLL